MGTALELRELFKSYGDFEAVKGVSMKVPAGTEGIARRPKKSVEPTMAKKVPSGSRRIWTGAWVASDPSS